jgi:hypothetical protein
MKCVVRILSLFLVVVLSMPIMAQDIEVTTEEKDNITTVIAKNSSTKFVYSVKIDMKCTGYKVTAAPPYEVAVLPGETVEIVKLIDKPNEKQEMSFGVSYKKVINEQEMHNEIIATKKVTLNKDTVFVFSGVNCDKSKLCLDKLSKSKLKFVDVPLSEDQNNELLSRVLVEIIKPGVLFHYSTPIIVVNGKPLVKQMEVDEYIRNIK